ncbi:YybH family protein [Rufibacter roseolus]|uniref:YybH family protein n=1 Tax=Rufibacter roseolus TaxID=2817375 RepID=UPI001B314A00|nr:DUF4440 domain-containing protein [Rufibacter roseolus]
MQTAESTITDEIKTQCREFENAFARGDAAGIASLYTQNGVILPSGSDIVRGKEGIRQFWQGAIDAGIKACRLDTFDVEQVDNTAIEMGYYTLLGDGSQALDRGKYLVVWKKEAGDWKLQKDIWNSNPAS